VHDERFVELHGEQRLPSKCLPLDGSRRTHLSIIQTRLAQRNSTGMFQCIDDACFQLIVVILGVVGMASKRTVHVWEPQLVRKHGKRWSECTWVAELRNAGFVSGPEMLRRF